MQEKMQNPTRALERQIDPMLLRFQSLNMLEPFRVTAKLRGRSRDGPYARDALMQTPQDYQYHSAKGAIFTKDGPARACHNAIWATLGDVHWTVGLDK